MDNLTRRMLVQDRNMQKAFFGSSVVKKNRAKLTPSQRLYVWEHPKLYGRKCNICGSRITKQSDLELDHTHPYSKGGKKMNLTHKECNRMKGNKNLKNIQKKMVFKTKKKRTITKKKTTKRRRRSNDLLGLGKIKWGM